MNSRLKKLTSIFPKYNIDALLITKSVNITYLTKYPSSDSWLLVTPQKAYYLTDSRYTVEIKKNIKDVSVIELIHSLEASLFDKAKSLGIKRLGIDERHVSHAKHKHLVKTAPQSIKLVQADGLVENLRILKDSNETRLIKKALTIHQDALKYLKRVIKPGVRERDVLFKLEVFVKSRGVGFSFDPIVASGPNSSYPHALVTSRKFGKNDCVLLDFGIDVDGYKSDLTRMFFLGKIAPLVSQINREVAEAQRRAIAAIQPGIPVSDVDHAARNYLKSKKLDQYFGHALGHGVGLEIHEDPRLSQKDASHLIEGMVVTVEPAVYLPNKFGIRLEEMVLVTRGGCEVLSGGID